MTFGKVLEIRKVAMVIYWTKPDKKVPAANRGKFNKDLGEEPKLPDSQAIRAPIGGSR